LKLFILDEITGRGRDKRVGDGKEERWKFLIAQAKQARDTKWHKRRWAHLLTLGGQVPNAKYI
jgi:hypothetical protein